MISHRTAGELISCAYRILESLAALAMALELLTGSLEKAAAYGVVAIYFHLCGSQIERANRK